MRHTLQIAAQARLVELESKYVGCDVLESVRLVDDEVLGLRQEGATHSGILQEKRVVHDDDPGVDGGLARALQVAVRPRGPLAAPLVARLVVRGDSRPELALSPHEVQLGAIAALGGGAPHESLGHEACFLTSRHRAAQDLPATGTQVIRTAFEHGDRDGASERELQSGQILPDELVLQRKRVRRDDHAFSQSGRRESRHRVRDRLPYSGARLGHQRATVRECSLDGLGEFALLRTILISDELRRERAVRREHSLD